MATTNAPLLTTPVMEKIETFVENIPSDVLAFWMATYSADQLIAKFTDLLSHRTEVVSEQPKKRGRPAGSKNKPKDTATEVTETPKKRGRPAGSKTKPKDVAPATEDTETPKKRGRPVGSKNKPKDVSPTTELTETPKKRGRPTGSKNKPKTPDAPTNRPHKFKNAPWFAATVIQRAWRARHSPANDPATEVTETPKKRGRPAGSKNKSNTPDAPTKRPRKPDQHTRKSKKSMTAATVIQRAWRTSH